MDKLPIEIKSIILNLLDLKSQINFVFASKINQTLIKYWIIKDLIYVNEKLIKLSYYDCFESIKISELLCHYPNKLRKLIFCEMFNQPLKNIPLSVTHLRFGYHFNKSLIDSIRREAPCVCHNPVFAIAKTGFAKYQNQLHI